MTPPLATVFTIGHGTRSLDELDDILRDHSIDVLADVRSYPRSRTNPQFNCEHLEQHYSGGSPAYQHLSELGGRRRKSAAADKHSALRVSERAQEAIHVQLCPGLCPGRARATAACLHALKAI